jgi:hypothetical protein
VAGSTLFTEDSSEAYYNNRDAEWTKNWARGCELGVYFLKHLIEPRRCMILKDRMWAIGYIFLIKMIL